MMKFRILPLSFLPLMALLLLMTFALSPAAKAEGQDSQGRQAMAGEDRHSRHLRAGRRHAPRRVPFLEGARAPDRGDHCPGGAFPAYANAGPQRHRHGHRYVAGNAASSVMALGLDPQFDLTHAYILMNGIAGANPDVASLGSAAWSNYVIGDVGRYIDPHDAPKEWPYGFFASGASGPGQMPAPRKYSGMGDGDVDLYALNPRAYSLRLRPHQRPEAGRHRRDEGRARSLHRLSQRAEAAPSF